MSAKLEDILDQTDRLSDESTGAFPRSRKVHVRGSRDDLRVGMREISQTPTPADGGNIDNPAITLYDTSGP